MPLCSLFANEFGLSHRTPDVVLVSIDVRLTIRVVSEMQSPLDCPLIIADPDVMMEDTDSVQAIHCLRLPYIYRGHKSLAGV